MSVEYNSSQKSSGDTPPEDDDYLPPYSEIFKPGLPGSRTVIGVAQMTYYPRTPDYEAALLEHLPYLDEVTPDTVKKWLGLDDSSDKEN
ncbi:hypothetical protein [Candidatus Nanosynbacter sp. TM7-053]|uniref:hypothetical protein n=1 Tax=Candidatus Nanosynbacter sp. TM7-053 TaxID=2902634 RepID=UPI001FB645A6|nr:hypothetical protein [Candidatus Nanosynbacter sp. TM7-053]MCJ1965817.1 hypothetical protein [Candidatus Nanosynbacter sp. TM7-053]